MQAEAIKRSLAEFIEPERAQLHQRFFKTGKGEYGEGDKFLGIRVPYIRSIARANKNADHRTIKSLLSSDYHEHRHCALLIMYYQIKKADEKTYRAIYDLYLDSAKKGQVNNWDLVDCSAPDIVGGYLAEKPRDDIYKLANSGDLWLERIAIMSTFYFIRHKLQFDDTLNLATQFLSHPHDLIHKATGWMLREVGKQDINTLRQYLNQHYQQMPRTMLRYAIEKLPENERQAYLKGRI